MRHKSINDALVVIGSFAAVSALKAVDTTSSNNYPQYCSAYTDDYGEYYLDRTSTATESSPSIISPNTGIGRWIQKTGIMASLNPANLIKVLYADPTRNKSLIQFVYPTTDYTMAQQLGGIALSPSDKQIVTLASGYDYLHGTCIAGDYLIVASRVSAGSPARLVRMNLNDLTVQSSLVLPDATYNGAEQLVYVPSKGKIYFAHNSTGNDCYVTELDPFSTPMVATRVVSDLAIGYRMYYPTVACDGTYLYVVSGVQTLGATLKIRKYNITGTAPYALVSELDTGIVAGGHSIKYDGVGSLFVTTSYRTVAVQQYILRIDVATFALVDQGSLPGESYTDDMTIVGDYAYAGMEYIFNSVGTLTIARAKKSQLSTVDLITIPTIKASCYGVSYDGQYLWCLAASSPGNVIRINPETLIADVFTTPTGEEIPNEYLFDPKTNSHYLTYWQQPAKVARYSKLQYQQTIVLRVNEGIVSDLRLAPENITKAALSTLITGNALIPNKQYAITDSTQGGKIIVTANGVNQLNNSALWLKNTFLPAFGWIRLTGGASGSVDSITFNSFNILTGTVPFTTSLANTATLVAANINANFSFGYTAIAMNDVVVIRVNSPGASSNGLVIGGTSTTITLGNIQNAIRGVNSTVYSLEIKYDVVSDLILSCYDPILNNRIECSKSYINYAKTTLGADPILDFRWGDPCFIDNRVKKGYIKDVYIAGDGLFEANTFEDFSFVRNVIGTSSSYFGINSCYGAEAVVRNNTMIGTFTQIIRNDVKGPITNNTLLGSQSKISSNQVFVKSDPTYIISGITGNVLSGTSTLIAYNILDSGNTSSQHTKISNNILSGNASLIWGNVMFGESSYIDGNTLSIANAKIRKNKLFGSQSGIYGNIISGGSASGIYDCVLNGYSCYISNNTIISTAGGSQGIIECYLNAYNTVISGCTVDNSGFIGRITLDAVNASIISFTTTALLPRVENIHWRANNVINIRFTKTGLNGGTNNGLAGSAIYFGIIPVAKAYPVSGTIEGNGITVGVGGRIQFGFETDDNQNLMIDSATSAFSGPLTAIVTMTKSTVNNRPLIGYPSVANITAGSFEITATFNVSSF